MYSINCYIKQSNSLYPNVFIFRAPNTFFLMFNIKPSGVPPDNSLIAEYLNIFFSTNMYSYML
jgi:hypothetical protein